MENSRPPGPEQGPITAPVPPLSPGERVTVPGTELDVPDFLDFSGFPGTPSSPDTAAQAGTHTTWVMGPGGRWVEMDMLDGPRAGESATPEAAPQPPATAGNIGTAALTGEVYENSPGTGDNNPEREIDGSPEAFEPPAGGQREPANPGPEEPEPRPTPPSPPGPESKPLSPEAYRERFGKTLDKLADWSRRYNGGRSVASASETSMKPIPTGRMVPNGNGQVGPEIKMATNREWADYQFTTIVNDMLVTAIRTRMNNGGPIDLRKVSEADRRAAFGDVLGILKSELGAAHTADKLRGITRKKEDSVQRLQERKALLSQESKRKNRSWWVPRPFRSQFLSGSPWAGLGSLRGEWVARGKRGRKTHQTKNLLGRRTERLVAAQHITNIVSRSAENNDPVLARALKATEPTAIRYDIGPGSDAYRKTLDMAAEDLSLLERDLLSFNEEEDLSPDSDKKNRYKDWLIWAMTQK